MTGKPKTRRFIAIIGFLLTVLLITVLTVAVSWWYQFWDGYPRGTDVISHLFRINQILEFWPHFKWFHSWSGGTPHFLWYPSVSYLSIAAAEVVTSLSPEFLLTLFGVLSVALAALAVFLVTYELTKTYLLSLAGTLIYIVTPAVWSVDFSMAGYNRGISIAFLGLSLWACVWWLRTFREAKENRLAYFLTVIFLGLSFITHYVCGPQAFAVVFVLIIFGLSSWSRRIAGVIKVLIPAGLLTAIFVLPLVLTRTLSDSMVVGQESFRFEDMFVPGSSLFYLFTHKNIRGFSGELFRLSPLLLPLLIVLVGLVIFFRRKALSQSELLLRVFLGMTFISLLLIIYATVYFPFLKHYGSGILDPRMTLFFLPSFLAPMVPIGVYWLVEGRLARQIAGFFLIISAALWFFIQFPYGGLPRIQAIPSRTYLSLPVYPLETQFNFRFGTGNYSNIAESFNYQYPYVPQTRDYFATGVVAPDYYVYLIMAGWQWENNYPETNFLFDWWGTKQFAVMNDEAGVEYNPLEKFTKQPNDYTLLGSDELFSVFEYQESSMVTSVTDVPALLIIGSEKTKAYNLAFRSLAQSNLNSRYIIPVYGKEFIDEYKLDELKQFPVLLLHDYKFHNSEKAGLLLKEYVENGGGLIIEANKTSEGKKEILEKLRPYPVDGVARTDFGKQWYLTTSNRHKEILANIDFTKFAPAIFNDGPWGIAYASGIKEWAKPVLYDKGKPVIVAGELGRGKVIWSGMNLLYHIVTYNNEEESRLLGQMVAWVQGKEKLEPEPLSIYQEYKDPDSKSLFFESERCKIEFVHPEKRIVTLKNPAKGVLFKEAWFQNWHVSINGKRGRIYKAGPEFMYVPLAEAKAGDKIEFVFGTHFIQWLGRILSTGTFFGLVFYLFNWRVFKDWPEKVKMKLLSPVKHLAKWWGNEAG